jgi:archaellum component FlaC
MESLFKKNSGPGGKKNIDRESDKDQVVEEEIELKIERSDTAKAIDRLQQQLENLEKEIRKLKKDF